MKLALHIFLSLLLWFFEERAAAESADHQHYDYMVEFTPGLSFSHESVLLNSGLELERYVSSGKYAYGVLLDSESSVSHPDLKRSFFGIQSSAIIDSRFKFTSAIGLTEHRSIVTGFFRLGFAYELKHPAAPRWVFLPQVLTDFLPGDVEPGLLFGIGRGF